MQTTGLLKEIIPELENCVGVEQPGGFHKYDVFEHTLHSVDAAPKKLRVRLAMLFHDITKPIHRRLVGEGSTFWGHDVTGGRVAEEVLLRLRFSKEIARDVKVLAERHMFTTSVTDKGMRRLIKRVGVDLIFDLLDVRRADVVALGMGNKTDDVDEFEAAIREEIDRKPPFSLQDLVIDGKDIMRIFNIPPGKKVGEVLDPLLEAALDDPAVNTPEVLEEIAKDYIEDKNRFNAANDKEPNS